MFAGAGDFFRPVDLRKEVSPSAPIRPVSRSGDEPQKHSGDEPQKFSLEGQQDSGAGHAAADDAANVFIGDAVELSIAALFVMLAGCAPPRTGNTFAPPRTGDALVPAQTDSPYVPPQTPRTVPLVPVMQDTHRAFDAYQRAVSALPPDALLHATDHHGAQGAGGEIFYMLAALEKAGVQAVNVAGGQTIYAALRAQCRAHDIALAVPVSAPDNTTR